MKRTLYSIMILFAGLLSGLNVSAQESEVIYTVDFTKTDFKDWVPEGDYAADGLWTVTDGKLVANGKMVMNNEFESRLVSPFIQLGGSNNTVSMNYMAFNFTDMTQEIHIFVREEGGEWADVAMNYPAYPGPFESGEMAVPADFDGKNVQFAFVYTLISIDIQGMWMIDNFTVKGVKGAADEKKDPEISFNVGDVEAILGQEFEAPVVNNPNGVEVAYSSMNPEVATVDPQTGAVTLVAEGFTTITATSVANDQYKAASVNYVLTVLPADAASIIFEEYFETGLGEFTVEGFNGEGGATIWKSVGGAAVADAFGKIQEETTNYLVSPVIALDAEGNKAEFSYHFENYDADYEIENQFAFCVREVGGEWEELPIEYKNADDTKCAVIIPSAYAGKNVQVAFKYVARQSVLASIFHIYEIVIKKAAAAPVEKKDPELSFAEESYDFYFNTSSFKGVALNNPYNVEVVYKIINNDYSVCDVDPYTGEVYLYNYGTAVITAESEENDEFKAGSASYTLNVTDIPTSIEGVNMDTLEKGKIYDLQGRRVNKLAKGVFILNGKKVIIK